MQKVIYDNLQYKDTKYVNIFNINMFTYFYNNFLQISSFIKRRLI